MDWLAASRPRCKRGTGCFHRFYESHNFKIQTDEGRDAMMADLEAMHVELFNAWQIASGMTATVTAFLLELRSKRA